MAAVNPYDPPESDERRTRSRDIDRRLSFAWWTRILTHEESVEGSRQDCYERLVQHYQELGVTIVEANGSDLLTYTRGSTLASIVGICPESSCRHSVTLSLVELDHNVRICWTVDLKASGACIGRNAILEEFRQLAVQW